MRWLEPEVTVAPTGQPVSLDDAKAHLRVDDTDSDALITAYLASAVAYVEQVCGLKLAAQTIKLRAWGFDDCTFPLPMAPISAVSGITYIDADGATQTLDPSTYVTALYGLSPTISRAYNKTWPAHRCGLGNITFTVSAGYADGACPTPITQAILLCVGDWWSNRETSIEGRFAAIEMVAVDALLANFRR